jgi:phage gp37-like protein
MGQSGAMGQIVGQNRTFRAAAVSRKLAVVPVNRMSTASRRVAVAATRLVVGQVLGLAHSDLQPLWLAASAEEREFRTTERPSRQRQVTDSDADALYPSPVLPCRDLGQGVE